MPASEWRVAFGVIGIVAAIGLAGCDEVRCPGPIELEIVSPREVLEDSDPASAGLQTDVRVATTLEQGDEVALEVLAPDGEVFATAWGEVDARGEVTLAGVTLPARSAILRARGTGTCGTGEVELAIEIGIVISIRHELSGP